MPGRHNTSKDGGATIKGGAGVSWIYLSVAVVLEVAGTASLKLSDGLTRLVPSLLIIPAYDLSFTLLALALKQVPVSVAYAIWSAVGTALITGIGMAFFREPVNPAEIAFTRLIIVGCVGLHLADRAAAQP